MDQGVAVGGVVAVGGGVGLLVVGAGAWVVGATVGERVGAAVCDGVGATVGQGGGVAKRGLVWAVVACGRGFCVAGCSGAGSLGAGVLLMVGVGVVGVIADVGGGGSMK